jgi:hypothetical protein
VHKTLSLLVVASLVACSTPDRRPAVYAAAGMAGRNNPTNGSGDEDNLSAGLGVKLPLGLTPVTLRADAQTGDLTTLLALSLTHDCKLAGDGLGSIDAHFGVGVSVLTERHNSVLGDQSSLFARAGAEGYLVHGVIGGACLLVAPWGYAGRGSDDLALAGLFYVGVRF